MIKSFLMEKKQKVSYLKMKQINRQEKFELF